MKALKKVKVKTQRTAIRSPNMVALSERFVRTIKQECLDPFIVFGKKYMDVLCREFVEHYHEERSHQGLENELISQPKLTKRKKKQSKSNKQITISLVDVRCKERLGGLLKSYFRKAA